MVWFSGNLCEGDHKSMTSTDISTRAVPVHGQCRLSPHSQDHHMTDCPGHNEGSLLSSAISNVLCNSVVSLLYAKESKQQHLPVPVPTVPQVSRQRTIHRKGSGRKVNVINTFSMDISLKSTHAHIPLKIPPFLSWRNSWATVQLSVRAC